MFGGEGGLSAVSGQCTVTVFMMSGQFNGGCSRVYTCVCVGGGGEGQKLGYFYISRGG